MKILIANDDGVHSVGIQALTEAMQKIAEVLVVAPDRDRSGASSSLTLHKPLRMQLIKPGFFAVEGTPSDGVHLALTGAVDFVPDLVVSGINHGANLGDDVLYSGTVAAAIEARMSGFTAVAFSLAGSGGKHQYFDTAQHVCQQIISQIQKEPLPTQSLLNVNIPNIPLDELQGFEITRTGRRHPASDCVKQVDPRGKEVFWLGVVGEKSDSGPGTDFHAIDHKKVSITPIQLDLTHYSSFDMLVSWADPLFKS